MVYFPSVTPDDMNEGVETRTKLLVHILTRNLTTCILLSRLSRQHAVVACDSLEQLVS